MTHTAAFTMGLVALTATVGIATIPTVDNGVASPPWSVPVSKAVVRQALPHLRGRGPVLVDLAPDDAAYAVAPAVLAALTTHGIPYVVRSGPQARQLGDNRAWNGHNARLRVLIVGGSIGHDPYAAAEQIAYVPSLSRAAQRTMYELQARVIERIRAAGGVTLTPLGRLALAKHIVPSSTVDAIVHARTKPQLITDSRLAHDLVHPPLIDVRPLGQADVLRYGDLSNRWIEQTVAVVVEPLA